MQRRTKPPKPAALEVAAAIGGIAVLVAGYLVAMRLTIGVSRVETKADADHRDLVYALLHIGALALALAGGFVLGKWMSGLGFAWALLFVSTLAVVMVVAQLGAHELACHGHNDIIRHWTC